MIKVESLTLRYGKKDILKNLSYEALDGKINVILGKNGSGKTSLIRALEGSIKKMDGNIIIGDKPIVDYNVKELAKVISVLPQNLPKPAITVNELVSFGRFPYVGSMGILNEQEKEKCDDAMLKAGVNKHKNSLVCHLSGGERQLAYFAMVLAKDTPYVLLDEPISNLDTIYAQSVLSTIRKMKEDGKTILLVLHDLDEAVAIADKIDVIDGGELVFSGTPEEFCQSSIPEEVFAMKYEKVTDGDGEHFGVFMKIKM